MSARERTSNAAGRAHQRHRPEQSVLYAIVRDHLSAFLALARENYARFGGSLNLHVHFHVLFVEGLFTRDAGALPCFHASSAPTPFDLLDVLTRVRDSVRRWLARTGYQLPPTTTTHGRPAPESRPSVSAARTPR